MSFSQIGSNMYTYVNLLSNFDDDHSRK